MNNGQTAQNMQHIYSNSLKSTCLHVKGFTLFLKLSLPGILNTNKENKPLHSYELYRIKRDT